MDDCRLSIGQPSRVILSEAKNLKFRFEAN